MLQLLVTLQTLPALLLDRASRIQRDDKGAAMVEYALLCVGIAVVVGAAAAALGTRITGRFDLIVP